MSLPLKRVPGSRTRSDYMSSICNLLYGTKAVFPGPRAAEQRAEGPLTPEAIVSSRNVMAC